MTRRDPSAGPCRACGSGEQERFGPEHVRCLACRSINRRAIDDLDAQYRTAWFGAENGTHATGLTGPELAEQLVGLVELPVAGLQVLDFGAGSGALSQALAKHGALVTAFEPYGPDAGIADVRWVSSTTALVDGDFDIIYAVEVIEHLPDPAQSLRLIRSLLRPQGSLILTTPNAAGLNARSWRWRWREAQNRTHLCLFTAAGIIRCGQRAGFNRIDRLSASIDFGHGGSRALVGRGLQRLRLDGSLRCRLSAD